MKPELNGRVSIGASVSPSEDPEIVATAVRNIVGSPDVEVRLGRRGARFESDDYRTLSHLRDQLRDRHVRAAARRLMIVRKERNSTSLMLNRQAAAVGLVVVCSTPGESPLGPIYVTMESRRLDELMDWLAAYESG